MQTQVRLYNFVKSDQIIYYLIILTVALGLKFHYSRAGSDDLEWILKPTAKLCQLITSVEFEYESGSGYISRERRIIIAPSCAGVNFMIAAFILAAVTGLRNPKKARPKIFWLTGSLVGAYLTTIAVNALRIIIAIYTIDANFDLTWLNPERIHRFQGIFVYFFSLIVFYQIVHKINNMRFHNSWMPFLTYSAIVLGIPLIMRAWQNNFSRFMEHFFTVIGVSLLISVLFYFIQRGIRSHEISLKKD
ncbi:exosortase K [Desulfococcaceae bacterium HSG9]|nr:exosortase K [Desulfococcaceae bacterium HSG9]